MLYFENELLLRESGTVGVCTFWSPIKKYKEQFEKDDNIRVMGQLKTARGIDYMEANCQRLGIQNVYCISGKHDINMLSTKLINRNIKYYIVNSFDEIKKHELVTAVEAKVTSGIPILPDNKGGIFDFSFYGEFDQIWQELLYAISIFGGIANSQYGKTKELVNVKFSPIFVKRNLKDNFHNYSSGWEEYANRFITGEPSTDSLYSYGSLIKLCETVSDKHSRCCFYDLYGAWDRGRILSSPPCLTSIQLIERQGKLFCNCMWRSNDVYKALPANIYGLAKWCESKNPDYVLSFTITSAHVYDTEFDKLPTNMITHKGNTFDRRCSISKVDNKLEVLDYEGNVLVSYNLDNFNLLTFLRNHVTNFEHEDYIRNILL